MIRRFYAAMGGRSTTFAWIALLVGTILALLGKLNTEFVALCGTLAIAVAGRAVAQDLSGTSSSVSPQNSAGK